MRATYTLAGVQGLQAALERGGKQIQMRVSAALEETARAVQRSARSFAPRDKGDLMRAIQIAGRGLNWRVGLDNASILSRGGRNSAHQNPAVYGVWYELGFVTRNIHAHPFMKPAADGEERAHTGRVESAINAAVGEF